MKLTNKQASNMLQAFMMMDSAIVGEGSGEVRLKVAHNIKKLNQLGQVAAETRRKIFTEVTGGENKLTKDDPRMQEIGLRLDEMDNTELEEKLWKIPYSKLDPDKVSTQVLGILMPLIEGIPDLGEPDA